MSSFQVGQYSISFPYEKPYDIQKEYMAKVINCLENKKHGILESPTGTGKTLCLFAPVVSWLKEKKYERERNRQSERMNMLAGDDIGVSFWASRHRVWYTARTHSQIAQSVGEIRRCDVQGLSIRVMGAREQLCVNEDVLSEKDSFVKTIKCKELVKSRTCRYYRKLEYDKHSPAIYQTGEVLDIEDLVTAGKKLGVCPYYLARQAKDTADIVLLPYNYIIDRDSRDSDSGSFVNSVVIFDEGHNVPNTCEESFEFTLSNYNLALGITNMKHLMDALQKILTNEDYDEEFNAQGHVENSIVIMSMLKELEKGLNEMPVAPVLCPMQEMYSFFEKAGVNEESSQKILRAMEEFKADAIKLQLPGPLLTTMVLIERMLNVAYGPAIKSFPPDLVEQSFKFLVGEDTENSGSSKKLSLFCFNPSFGIKDVLLLGIQSLIITSGTLSPIRSFVHELGITDPITLENGHIASKEQIPFMILGTGVNNIKMDASFRNRNESSYMFSLGMTLTNLIGSVPDGVLLLFSSYSMMRSLKESWENGNIIWKRLNTIKRVFLEPRGKEEFLNCMENYRRSIDAGNGAVLMGVLRGKISEGMDFKDQYCRAVFIVGVPFPPVMDPRVKGKERYSESLTIQNPVTKKMEKLYDNAFMSVEAMKATNQAIGRVIRHGADYGAIVLVDYRFAWPRLFNNISKWIRGDEATEVNFMTAKKTLREFFKRIHTDKNLQERVPEVVCQKVGENGEPVASLVSYQVYDHKQARANQCQSAFISTGLGSRNRRGRSNIKYEDSESPESTEDLLSPYRMAKRENIASPSAVPAVDPTKASAAISSCLDAIESSSSVPQGHLGYGEVDMKAIPADPEKRKYEELSPTLLTSSRKKIHRRVQPSLVKGYEPEPVALSAEEKRKINIINYCQEANRFLSHDESQIFKTCVQNYKGHEISLEDIKDKLQMIFNNNNTKRFIAGFEVCLKEYDLATWKKLVQQLP